MADALSLAQEEIWIEKTSGLDASRATFQLNPTFVHWHSNHSTPFPGSHFETSCAVVHRRTQEKRVDPGHGCLCTVCHWVSLRQTVGKSSSQGWPPCDL